MERRVRVAAMVVAGCYLAAVLSGCVSQSNATSGIPNPDASAAGLQGGVADTALWGSLEWRFEGDSLDERDVGTYVKRLESGPLHPDSGSVAVVYRFGMVDTHRRYLLMAFMPEPSATASERRPVAIIALGAGAGADGYSAPHVIGVASLGRFGIDSVADFDADGLPDVAYCEYPDDERAPGQPHVVGYRSGRWYPIAPAKANLACPPEETDA